MPLLGSDIDRGSAEGDHTQKRQPGENNQADNEGEREVLETKHGFHQRHLYK